MLNAIKSLFGFIGRGLSGLFKLAVAVGQDGNPIKATSDALKTIAVIGVSILNIRKFVKVVKTSANESAVDKTQTDRESIKQAMKKSIDKDQDVNQDIAKFGYTYEEMSPAMREKMEEYRQYLKAQHRIIMDEENSYTSPYAPKPKSKKYKFNDPEYDALEARVNRTVQMILKKKGIDMTNEEFEDFCDRQMGGRGPARQR